VIYKISIIFLINLIVFYFEHKFRRVARLSESAVVGIPKVRRYLVVPRNGECTILQLFGRKARQDVGNISGNIGSGGECDLLVAVTANGHFPARDVEIEEPLDLWLTGRKARATIYQETYDVQM
jgi:hypothetical protein